MLFVELALIRWTGSNIVYLSYFSNFVLLGSFLGIGVGFLRARARVNLFPWAPLGLGALVLFVLAFPVQIDRSGSELVYFGTLGHTSGLPTWVTLPIVFVAVAGTMAMIAEGVARTFVLFEPLEAYRLDVIGSLLGIGAFSLLALLRAPPLAWGLVAAAAFLLLFGRAVTVLQIAALVAIAVMLESEAVRSHATWSPYYKVRVVDGALGRQIFVNGVSHQTMQSISQRRRYEPTYFKPYERMAQRRLDDVLIVGAGSGNDVAIALQQGAKHVDAVEIDPRIYEIGRAEHPNRPYADRRVDVHIDDGRAFLERTHKRYDLILFALPDSLTLVAGQSSLRLESYLFTREAIDQARSRLKPHGVFGMYNYYREPWLVDRLGNTVAAAFGRAPCLDSTGNLGRLALLSDSSNAADIHCTRTWAPSGTAPAPATDNHPFVYLKANRIPGFYLLTIALILAASLALVRAAAGPLRQMRPYLDLFCMGAAFLLLETKSVVQFALLFGTTWFVNALVFAGVLVAVLAAVETARRIRLPRPPLLYAGLLAALVVAWLVPQHSLLSLSLGPRLAAAIALAFTPIFLANLVFAQRFRDVGASSVAFGANLLGAMVGGLLEYTSLVIGFRALLLVVAVLYGLAFALDSRLPAVVRSGRWRVAASKGSPSS
jgi:spermidine synthase